MANKIVLIGQGRYDEFIAAGAITPGHLIEMDSAGKVVVHNSEGAYAERLIAIEDALQGKTVTDAYASGALVPTHVGAPGDVVQMFLKAGENVAIGADLISAGDGSLIAAASVSSGVTIEQTIGKATEALDLSASGAVKTLLAVRLL